MNVYKDDSILLISADLSIHNCPSLIKHYFIFSLSSPLFPYLTFFLSPFLSLFSLSYPFPLLLSTITGERDEEGLPLSGCPSPCMAGEQVVYEWNVCVSVYVNVCASICVCVCVSMCLCKCKCMCFYVCLCKCKCMCSYVCLFKCMYVIVSVRKFACVCVCVRLLACR